MESDLFQGVEIDVLKKIKLEFMFYREIKRLSKEFEDRLFTFSGTIIQAMLKELLTQSDDEEGNVLSGDDNQTESASVAFEGDSSYYGGNEETAIKVTGTMEVEEYQ